MFVSSNGNGNGYYRDFIPNGVPEPPRPTVTPGTMPSEPTGTTASSFNPPQHIPVSVPRRNVRREVNTDRYGRQSVIEDVNEENPVVITEDPNVELQRRHQDYQRELLLNDQEIRREEMLLGERLERMRYNDYRDSRRFDLEKFRIAHIQDFAEAQTMKERNVLQDLGKGIERERQRRDREETISQMRDKRRREQLIEDFPVDIDYLRLTDCYISDKVIQRYNANTSHYYSHSILLGGVTNIRTGRKGSLEFTFRNGSTYRIDPQRNEYITMNQKIGPGIVLLTFKRMVNNKENKSCPLCPSCLIQ